MEELEMCPLSYWEIKEFKFMPFDVNNIIESDYLKRDEVIKLMFNGSMPDVVFNGTNRELFYSSYIDLYIEI